MNRWFCSRALGAIIAIAALTACNASNAQPPLLGSGAQMRATVRSSWMAPGTSSQDLMYVTHDYATNVSVYSYPQGKLVGTLANPDNAIGDCVDASGNVFIVNFDTPSLGPGDVVEYAHGGTSPIATLTYPNAYLYSCASDPTTGNLAVTDNEQTQGKGGVLIYPNGSGTPTKYRDPGMADYSYCTFDNHGNLFVDGANISTGSGYYRLDELPKGKKNFNTISLSKRLATKLILGAVQWDGTYLVIGYLATAFDGRWHNHIYRLRITGKSAKIVNQIDLKGAHVVNDVQFWIQGSTILMPYGSRAGAGIDLGPGETKLGLWTYPQGQRTSFIRDREGPWGVTVSLAAKH